jgi:TatD DNase family protein
MKYIDIHCHLQFPEYDADREEVIKRAEEAQVGMINVGTDVEMSQKAIELAHTHANMWATVGVHPTDAKDEVGFNELERLAGDSKVVAIGECGLDYFHGSPEDIDRQREIFIQHIELANKVNKPLMLHVRNGKENTGAYHDAVEFLKKYSKVRANFHFFAGSLDDLKMILERGDTVSFTGVLSFTASYDELVKYVPLDRFMSETDAPYVAPTPYRGKRNEPSYVKEVVKAIARIKGKTEEEIASQTVDNARKLFGIENFIEI